MRLIIETTTKIDVDVDALREQYPEESADEPDDKEFVKTTYFLGGLGAFYGDAVVDYYDDWTEVVVTT